MHQLNSQLKYPDETESTLNPVTGATLTLSQYTLLYLLNLRGGAGAGAGAGLL